MEESLVIAYGAELPCEVYIEKLVFILTNLVVVEETLVVVFTTAKDFASLWCLVKVLDRLLG